MARTDLLGTQTEVTNYHVQYTDVTSQYWDAKSETFAGGDHLMTALYNGWDIEKVVEGVHSFTGLRSVTIYNFHLTRDGETLMMPVLDNPYIKRFLRDQGIDLQKEA